MAKTVIAGRVRENQIAGEIYLFLYNSNSQGFFCCADDPSLNHILLNRQVAYTLMYET